jgi:hypothetical protein
MVRQMAAKIWQLGSLLAGKCRLSGRTARRRERGDGS